MSKYWIPCTVHVDGKNKQVCANMEESDGFTNCQDCFTEAGSSYGYGRSCGYVNKKCANPNDNDCYISQEKCNAKVENYNDYGQKIGPNNYVKLGHTWDVQKPYNL